MIGVCLALDIRVVFVVSEVHNLPSFNINEYSSMMQLLWGKQVHFIAKSQILDMEVRMWRCVNHVRFLDKMHHGVRVYSTVLL